MTEASISQQEPSLGDPVQKDSPHHVKYPHSLPSKISSILPVQLTSMFLGYPYHKAHSIYISHYSLYITTFIIYHNAHYISQYSSYVIYAHNIGFHDNMDNIIYV
jgi:hypothetical protein